MPRRHGCNAHSCEEGDGRIISELDDVVAAALRGGDEKAVNARLLAVASGVQAATPSERRKILNRLMVLWKNTEPKRRVAVYLLFHRIGLPEEDKIAVCCEHLYDSDQEIRSVARRLLQIDVLKIAVPRRHADFTPIVEALGDTDNEAIKASAIRYMFQCDPSAAVDAMGIIDESVTATRQAVYLAKDEVEVAIAELRLASRESVDEQLQAAASKRLEEFASRDPWWCKLYVAETMARNDDLLGSPANLATLADEPNPLVKEAANKAFSREIVHYRRKARDVWR